MKRIIKRVSILVFICTFIFLVSGCDSLKKVHEHCTRVGTLDGGEVDLQYDIVYRGDRLLSFVGNEKVTSDDSSILDTYETSYKKINKNYEGINYYENKVTRTSNSVLSYTKIDYKHVDINRIIELEGADDNIFVDGRASVEKWKEFTKKVGTKCEVVE